MHCRLVRLRQAAESAEILLKATQLEGRGLVAGSVGRAPLHLLLPEPGASDQEQVTQKELHRLKGERDTQESCSWRVEECEDMAPPNHVG